MTLATSPGYLRYPPPTVYLADAHSSGRPCLADEIPLTSLPFLIWPSLARDDGRISLQHTYGDVGSSTAQPRVDPSASVRLLTYSTPSGQYELLLSPIDPNSSSPVPEDTGNDSLMSETDNAITQSAVDAMETTEVQPEERNNRFFPFGDPMYWELPFLQGWLIGQSQAGQRTMGSVNASAHENLSAFSEMENPVASSVMPTGVNQSRVTGRSSSRQRSSRSRMISMTGSAEGAAFNHIPRDEADPQIAVSRIQSELATSLAAAAAAELPCTVKLRIWPHDVKDPCAFLDAEKCRLTIPHAVLCRYNLFIILKFCSPAMSTVEIAFQAITRSVNLEKPIMWEKYLSVLNTYLTIALCGVTFSLKIGILIFFVLSFFIFFSVTENFFLSC
jgi:activator-of-BECN1-regulated-autophagy protein 1